MNRTEALNRLESLLKNGLNVDNLREMANICDKANKDENSLLFFVLEHVFRDLLDNFLDRPLETREYDYVLSKLKKPLIDLLEEAKIRKTDEDLVKQMKDIVGIMDHLYEDYSEVG